MPIAPLVWLVLVAWCVAVFVLGAAGAFVRPAGSAPLPVALGATLPIAAFLVAYRGSNAFRALVLSADLRFLAGVQAWRLGGFWFLALYTYDMLPGLFAWPAALGDMAVAIAAPSVIARLANDPAFAGSRAFALWNILGILDLVVAVSMGALSSGVVPGLVPVTTAVMAEMPLVLIPAFFVPLFIVLHLAALFQARRIAARSTARFGRAGAVPA
jgi:hypothetical protein